MMGIFSSAATLILAAFVFGIIIFIHELGHFLTAKWLGAGVKEFAIGMGPAIFKRKVNDTVYSLRLFPIGGYVNLEGEDEDSDSPKAFNRLFWWKRLVILSSGAFMNIVLGLLIVVIIVINSPVLVTTTVESFKTGAVSSTYGLEAGDRIVSINDYRIYIDMDIFFAIASSEKNKFDITVKRYIPGQGYKTVKLAGVKFPVLHDKTYGDIPITDFYLLRADKNVVTVMSTAVGRTISVMRSVIKSFALILTGQIGADKVSGPVGITQEIGNAAKRGAEDVIFLFALITLNLGIVNLFPLPALDGGRIAFVLVEVVRGKPLNPKYEGVVHLVGFVLLIMLMIFVSFNDIIKLFGNWEC